MKEKIALFRLYDKAVGLNLIEGACRACSAKMGTLQAAEAQGLASWTTWPGIAP